MKITLDITKTIQENASTYFERAKKAKSKLPGAKKALEQAQEKAAAEQQAHEIRQTKAQLKNQQTHWYHKYHWSKTTNGHLIVAGQNAAANESIIKHHSEKTDIVFHTDMKGSPFTLLKAEGKHTQEDLEEAAQITAAYSKAWQAGMTQIDVFWVKPEQVTKEAQSGEYLTKGAFMIRGDTTYIHPEVTLHIGLIEQEGYHPQVFIGSQNSVKQHCSKHAHITPGDNKTSDIAKQLRKQLKGGELDAYIKAIPTGGTNIKGVTVPKHT